MDGFAYQGEIAYPGAARRGERDSRQSLRRLPPEPRSDRQSCLRGTHERDRAAPRPSGGRVGLSASPAGPMLFMGEEWGATEPFPFFCDFDADLAEAVREGRRQEFARFPEYRDPESGR